jgi:hypothetical protein
MDSVGYTAFKAALTLTQRRAYRRLIDASLTPRKVQENLLQRILTANAATEFGERHGFSQVADINSYRQAVPVQTYEDLRPYIEHQELNGQPCLTAQKPVYYQRTSGTVGEPKNIPITETGLRRIRHHQQVSAYAQSLVPEIFRGKVFGVTGQAIEGRMAGGTPFGSASGLLYQSQSRLIRSRYVLPAALSDIDDYESRYLAMAVYGLAEASVSCIATANPSTLMRLLSVINDNIDVILASVTSGALPKGVSLGNSANDGLRPNAPRADQLARVFQEQGTLSYSDIWPNLGGVVTWTGGSCAVPLRGLVGLLPDKTRIVELGYVASEFRGTINIDVQRNTCLPTLLDTVFEFVAREAWEEGSGDFLSLHELDEGREYYVFVTTAEGLYRYDMNDIIRVTGRVNETPTLEFVQKGKGVTNITGEKLHEAQVLDAVLAVLKEKGTPSNFFVMLADQSSAQYTLFVEMPQPSAGWIDTALSSDLDGRLRASNIEYDGKRGSGRLSPLIVRRLRAGTGDAYRRSRIAQGQRDTQFKFLHLQYAHECSFDFETFAEPGTEPGRVQS